MKTYKCFYESRKTIFVSQISLYQIFKERASRMQNQAHLSFAEAKPLFEASLKSTVNQVVVSC